MAPKGLGIQRLSDEWDEVSVAARWSQELSPAPAAAHMLALSNHPSHAARAASSQTCVFNKISKSCW